MENAVQRVRQCTYGMSAGWLRPIEVSKEVVRCLVREPCGTLLKHVGQLVATSAKGELMLAPEPYRSACLTVLYRAVLHARLMGFSEAVNATHLADLMDAVHNIPDLVRNSERCDIELLRTAFLKAYDDKWTGRSGLALCDIFDQVVAEK